MYSKQGAAGVIVSFIILTLILVISVTMMISYQSFVVESQERLNQKQDEIIRSSQISFEINNVTYNTTSEKLLFTITNTGTVNIEANEFNYFLNSNYLTNVTPKKIEDSSFEVELLEPSSQMQINYSINLVSGDYSLQIIHDFGFLRTNSFNIS